MAYGFKKLSDYILRGGSIGPGMNEVSRPVRSGLVAGPTRAERDAGFEALRKNVGKRIMDAEAKEINTKMQLSAMEAKSFNDTFKMKTDALAALRKEAPKDKLGNTIQTPEMDALQQDIIGMLRQKVGPQGPGLTPGEAGMTPEQQSMIPFDTLPGQQQQAPPPAQTREGGMESYASMSPGTVEHKGTGARAEKTGRFRQGQNGPELELRLPDGRVTWAPQSVLRDVSPQGQSFNIEDYFRQKNERAKAEERLGTEQYMIP